MLPLACGAPGGVPPLPVAGRESAHAVTDSTSTGDLTGLVAAVATLTAEARASKELMQRIEGDNKQSLADIKATLDKLDQTVHGDGGHADWIKARKRDGWWLGMGLVGLGAIASAVFDWWKTLLH